MNILFLHLSDAHIKNSEDLKFIDCDAIVNALRQTAHFDECVLVFSGDIAQSGKIEEYDVAKKLIDSISDGVRDNFLSPNKCVHVLIVPGNHDNFSKFPNRSHDDIKQYYVDKKVDKRFYDDLDELENFYHFVERFDSSNINKIIEVKKIAFDDFVLRINLVNSAPFSVLGSDNGDKGLHYFPKSELNKLGITDGESYTITIMHHSPEWFSDESKKVLYSKIIQHTNLLFLGHEHFALNEHKIINGYPLDVSTGIALNGTNTEHGFNALLLDTEDAKLIGTKFTYNGRIYSPSNGYAIKNDAIMFQNKYNFSYKYSFWEYLQRDEGQWAENSYLDYFVFPTLEFTGINSNINILDINTFEQFVSMLKKKKRLSIEGTSRSGKSVLSKYLCLNLSKDFVPILLHADDFFIKDDVKVIKQALEVQYGEYVDYNEFVQLKSDSIVLIVDQYDYVDKKRWNSFFEHYENNFEYMVLMCDPSWNVQIEEKAVDELMDNQLVRLRLAPFYYSKRQELIQKLYDNFATDVSSTNESNVVKRINDEIASEIKHFYLNPDFIHQYVIYYLKFSFLKTQTDTNVFSKVFEANIVFRLAQNTDVDDVNEILVALDFVAHKMHFSKRYTLSIDEFMEAVSDYNNQYDNNLKPKKVYDIAKSANIIRDPVDNFGVEFCSESNLAYFTALHLNRLFNEGKGAQELKYILDNACFKINGDIILFLSYITSNVQILNPIMTSLMELMKEWNEFDVEKDNIPFLNKLPFTVQKSPLPDSDIKQKHMSEKTRIEKDIVENEQHHDKSLYSYDESKSNSFSNKIFKALKYLELAAKILPNFRHILGKGEKNSLISILYTHPNKLIYFALQYLDKNFENIVDDIMAKHPITKQGVLITSDMVGKSLQTQAIIFIFCVYDFVAYTASSGKGLSELNKFSFESSENYMLQNLMMEENNGHISNFILKLNKLFDKTDRTAIKQIIMFVVRKFFLNHEVEIKGDIQSVVDKFFDGEDKRNLTLIQAKNRSLKK